MAEITIQEWRDRIEKLGAGEFRRRLNQRLTRAALDTEARAKLNAKARPRARSGRLYNSIRAFVLDEGRGPSIVLQAGGRSNDGKEVGYARTQEYGATIRAKGAGWLRIPIKGGPALNPSGTQRFGGSLRSYPGFFVFKAKSGHLYISRKGEYASNGGPLAYFRLKKSVKVPPTYFMRRAMDVTEKELRVELGDLWRVVHEERG